MAGRPVTVLFDLDDTLFAHRHARANSPLPMVTISSSMPPPIPGSTAIASNTKRPGCFAMMP
ncbi:hypothetical protein [Glaciihabitans sp. GrIS 2.15]|uniref:hypothetical protein n=1 Tax=Glaciihabitans sp. GrIS 2.15 TaxID=3071710 RepID=UPI002DF86BC6|nr:hypothetical protein [Glaciihabitans sp. GrIS 2.15]